MATITASDTPKAPQYAEIEPPPGAGDSLDVIFANSVIVFFDKLLFFSSIMYSMILESGLKGPNSSKPNDLTAI